MKLSILMPVYNEDAWIDKIVPKVLSQKVEGVSNIELIIVDDCSVDESLKVIKTLAEKHKEIKVFSHERNMGKGAALHTAIAHMTGAICLIQDADLEYNPEEYSRLLEPILEGRADVVYGSRFVGSQAKRVLFYWHSVGNRLLTWLSNMTTNLNFSDMETCYKAFHADFLKSIPLRSKRFGFEPEITAKISRRNARIFEVGISYNGRTYQEGKKIGWKDGLQAIYIILKYWLINDSKSSL